MNGSYPSPIYTWNHYDGEEAPQMNSIGLPNSLSIADLPTSIPSHVDMVGDDAHRYSELSYSPGLLEMDTTEPDLDVITPPPNSNAQPTLWAAVKKAVVSGNLSVSRQNSTAQVVAGNSNVKTEL